MTTQHAAALAALDAMRKADAERGADGLTLARVCWSCVRGEGLECHTPGCALWLRDVPPDGLVEAFTGEDNNLAVLDLIAAVLDEHHPITTSNGHTRCGGRTCWEWPCDKPAYRAAIRALGINEGDDHE